MNFLGTGELLPDRQPVVDALQDVLGREDRHGALVLGEAGLGKSYLLRALERSAPATTQRHVVRATRALSTVPYGALGEAAGTVSDADLSSPVSMLRVVRQRLGSAGSSCTSAVLVDDAQFLDEESAHVLTQLAVTGVIRIVAFADYSLSETGGLHTFAREGYLDRLHLEPLSADSLHAVAESALGTPSLGHRAALQLHRATGGNPMLLNAVIGHAASSGARTVAVDGCSPAPEEEPFADALADLVTSVVASMPEPQRKALDILALGGSVAAADLERLAGRDAVRSLVSQRLAATHPAGSRYLTLRYGLYADVIRATLPFGRKVLLRDELHGPAHVLPPYQYHRIRHLEWAVETGSPVAAGVLTDAARVATHLGCPESSERFIHALSGDQRLDADVERARLHAASGRTASALQLLTAHAADSTRDQAQAAVVLHFTVMRLAGAAPSELRALLDARAAPCRRDADTGEDGEHEGRLHLLEVQIHLDQGDPASAERLVAERRYRSLEARATGLGLRGEALGMMGRAIEAEQSTQAALGAAAGEPYALIHVTEDLLTQHILVLAHAGKTEQAIGLIEEAEAGPVPFGAAEALRGIVLIRQGDFRTGMRSLVPALARLRTVDPQLLLPYALGVASWGAAVLGDTDQALALADECRRLPRRGRIEREMLGHAFAAAAASLDPRAAEDTPSLTSLIAGAGSTGLRACEKDMLVLALLLGQDEGADRLARLVADMQGGEASILRSFARAVTAGDGAELADAADRAAASGLPLIAVNAAERARALQGAPAAGAEARAVARRLSQYSAPFVGTRFEVPGGARGVSDLSVSELAVARLAVTGESNKGMAQALSLSVRTVEGHLQRMYVKLAINGRNELMQVFQDQDRALQMGSTKTRVRARTPQTLP